MNKRELAEYYEFLIREIGYVPKIDEDNDVVFKVEGKPFLLILDEQDETFLRFTFPNFLSLESEDERLQAMETALYINKKIKAIKIILDDDNIWATVQLFYPPMQMSKKIVQRIIIIINAAAREFREIIFRKRKDTDSLAN